MVSFPSSYSFTSLPPVFQNQVLYSCWGNSLTISLLTHPSSGILPLHFCTLFGLLNYSLFPNSCHPLSHSSHALETLSHLALMLLPTRFSFFFPTFPTSYLLCLANSYSFFRDLLQDAFLESPLCPFWPNILLAAKKLLYICSLLPHFQAPILNWVPIIYPQVRCVCSVRY